MVEFRTDKEVLQIMGNCVDFVSELIDYIAEYPDDDYMTMECLCRKLVKYDLIDKEDGYYLVDKGIKIAEQTEPQTEMEKSGSRAVQTARCLNCHNAKACKENHWEVCKYEPWKLTAVEDEPQTEEIQDGFYDEYYRDHEEFYEPQTDCETCKYDEDDYDLCKPMVEGECRYEPQTDCSWKKGE